MNPFVISSYRSPDTFCDREKETKQIINAVTNERNIVISSIRRLGKTGLIQHVFHELKSSNDYYLFYIDIDPTNDINEFLQKLLNGLVKNQPRTISEKILDFLKKFRPLISFDPLSGQPEMEFRKVSSSEDENTIESVLGYLDRLDKPSIIALDEFQRITEYPESGVETFLRSHIQHLSNVHFIFSGSMRHILESMFGDYSRPFYQSAEILHLGRLNRETYRNFIADHFARTGKTIDTTTIDSGIDWTDNHTFYVQFLFNVLWGNGQNHLGNKVLQTVQDEIVISRDPLYTNYRNLLTTKQFLLLKAIALEEEVRSPTASEFIQTYQLGSASTVNSALKILVEKDLIYREDDRYCLYDVLQKRWFQQTY